MSMQKDPNKAGCEFGKNRTPVSIDVHVFSTDIHVENQLQSRRDFKV